MKRISSKLAICLLAFLIVSVVLAFWTFRNRRTKDPDAPRLGESEAPFTVCQLRQEPDRFVSQQIKVQGNLIGYHEPALYSPRCKGDDNYVRVDLDSASRGELIQAVGELNGSGMHGGNFWVHVILFGRFEKIEESKSRTAELDGDQKYIEYRYRLVASSVQSVAAVSHDAPWW